MTTTTEAIATTTINTTAFKSALTKFIGVVPAKSRRPELTDAICLTARAATGEVVLSSTNLDQALRLAIPATVEADAALVVSYKDLKAATGAVRSDRLTVDFAADAAAVFDTSATLTGRAHVVTAVEGYPTVLCGARTTTFSMTAGVIYVPCFRIDGNTSLANQSVNCSASFFRLVNTNL